MAAQGAPVQRLLWASTGTKDPKASDTLYISGLAAPDTVNTMPEATLLAFAEHGQLFRTLYPPMAETARPCWTVSRAAESTLGKLAEQLQREGAEAFVDSWNDLMPVHRIQGSCRAGRSGSLKMIEWS